eukprot:CAMPEP_0174336350 /NCGR_PEP_ID=MMETSP0810-20121108/21493_1 /TAXON_ID=73025 ORGANISM="Eutreptiella gymnastica-like, Strain CCMP1594" /NCGR_SAMPLE_ID=MMETSP0810 /ASSEMBLY_ACC=CAM_ASM_000659 /LENGTH=56 /DNA_ID=CAMNT_0015455237 /DNA_START=195 /DNA_END=365 /DNA_ORIENTATION=+
MACTGHCVSHAHPAANPEWPHRNLHPPLLQPAHIVPLPGGVMGGCGTVGGGETSLE